MKTETKITKQAAAAALGSRGGKAVAKKGKKYMAKIGRRGAKARWDDKEPKKSDDRTNA